MNICACGAQASYPHRDECPYPLYRGTDAAYDEWERSRRFYVEQLAYRYVCTCGAPLDEFGQCVCDHAETSL